uniref:GT23 domain-containing protein n=1 Tax=Arion vulgaris TaxID=1028688 RepID=A0A0B6ZPQ3_9EUPU
MKTFTFNVFQVRPADALVVVLTLCMCSVLMSVYYVHNVSIASPLDVMRANRGPRFSDKLDDVDDTWSDKSHDDYNLSKLLPEFLQNTSEDDVRPVLNHIDIASHIQRRNTEEKKQESQSPKKMQKENQWPNHENVQKKRKSFIPLTLQIYSNPERTRTNWTGERYIVYLCHSNLTCAGWGDRQHGIFSAYLLSLMTNRTFKVDMQSPCPLSKLYHPRLVNWKVNETEFNGLSSTHLYTLNDQKFRETMKIINFDVEYPQDVVYLTTNYDYFYSLKANPNYKEIFQRKVKGRPRPILFADLWQTIFKMNKRVVRKYTPALKKGHPSNNHKLACAHIRFGRNPTIPTDSNIRNTLTTIKPLWTFLDKYSDEKIYRIFVASDWQGFRDKVNSMYRNISVDVDGDIIHIDKMKELLRRENATDVVPSDPCLGFEKVIADQLVLSRCDILLLTYSVFGKAAAYLRRSNKDLYLMEGGVIKTLTLFNEMQH